jgi:hypothetical protein
MSEAKNAKTGRKDFHRRLLTGASALTLLVGGLRTIIAAADENSSPLWIELGGQWERISGSQDIFAPAFDLTMPRPDFEAISPLSVERLPPSSIGGEGTVSFEPSGTDWVFSASVRYGRAQNDTELLEHSAFPTHYTSVPDRYEFSDGSMKSKEAHLIVDFQAGKDFGFGMFGKGGSSVASFGVRFAQFGQRSDIALSENPIPGSGGGGAPADFTAAAHISRSFHGIGPSLSWTSSAPFAGHPDHGELSLDWGANASALFGRQRTDVQHQTNYPVQTSVIHMRARSAIVPNLGGFAGISYRLQNFKVKLGYRGDFFFDAMDGGINTTHKENLGFYGPFATIGVGLGG